MRVSKKYLAPSISSYPYWRLKSNIRFYKGVFCLFGHPHSFSVFEFPVSEKRSFYNFCFQRLISHPDKYFTI